MRMKQITEWNLLCIIFEEGEFFLKSYMEVSLIRGGGTITSSSKSQNKCAVLINSQNKYVNYNLKPLFSLRLPRLYQKEMEKVFLHHDKASSHTANLTTS